MKIVLSTILLCFSFWSQGQNNSRDINVTYSYINLGLNKNVNCELNISQQKSLFVFDLKNNEDSVFVDEYEVVNFSITGNDSIGTWVYKDFGKEELIFRDFVFTNKTNKPFIVTESMPQFEWDILDIREKVNNIDCQKATTTFRGRTYDVWYALDLPVNNGPWKFHGLPGLIVKVISSDSKIQFTITGIKKSTDDFATQDELATDDTITLSEYASYREKALDEFIQKLYSKLPRGASIKVNSSIDHNIETEF